jgi:hypothetical protein
VAPERETAIHARRRQLPVKSAAEIMAVYRRGQGLSKDWPSSPQRKGRDTPGSENMSLTPDDALVLAHLVVLLSSAILLWP